MTAPPQAQFPELALEPDAEEMIVRYLDARFRQLAGITMEDPAPVQVVTELWLGPPGPSFDEELPVVLVTRAGGGDIAKPVLKGARIDVDAYHVTKEAASQLARQIQALLAPRMVKNVVIAGGQICEVTEETGPSYRPSLGKARAYGLTHVYTIKKKGEA